MEINVKKLRETLELLEPAVPKKHTLPVVQFIRLGEGQAIATNLEVAVTVSVPEAAGEPVLLPLKQALEFLTYAPGRETAHIELTKGYVNITANSMSTRYQVPDALDFPPIPPAPVEGEGVLDGDALVRALVAISPYTATEQTRPILTGICLSPGGAVEVAAADGFRLAWEKVPGRLDGEKPLVIPGRVVGLLSYLWKRCAKPDMADIADPARLAVAKRLIRLAWGNGQLQLNFGEVRLLTQLVQRDFPKYRSLIPTGAAPSVTLMAEDMERALRPLKPVAKAGKDIVRLVWEGDTLTLSSKADEVGETRVEVPAACSQPGKIAIKLGYLLTYLGGKAGPVTLSTTSPSSPLLFAYRGTPHMIAMPMFVEQDGEAPAKAPPAPTAEADTWTPESGDIPQDTPEVEPEAKETPKPKGRRGKKG